MKRLFSIALASCAALCFLSSCGVANIAAVPCVSLDDANYQYVRTVQASCAHVYVFGIGGLKTKTPMQDLLKAAKLKDGEALVNVTISTHNKFCIFWMQRNFTIFGQVVRFVGGGSGSSAAATTPVVKEESVASSGTAGETAEFDQVTETGGNEERAGFYPSFYVNSGNYSVPSNGGKFFLKVWTDKSTVVNSAVSDASWLVINSKIVNNKITYSLEKNTTENPRTGHFTVTDNNGREIVITVTQSSKGF